MNIEVRNCTTIYDLENRMYNNSLGSSLEGLYEISVKNHRLLFPFIKCIFCFKLPICSA